MKNQGEYTQREDRKVLVKVRMEYGMLTIGLILSFCLCVCGGGEVVCLVCLFVFLILSRNVQSEKFGKKNI